MPTTPNPENQAAALQDFFQRRKTFDAYIQSKGLNIYTCPGCGYPSLAERGFYEICPVCNWEDDGQDDPDADEARGGPNSNLSLTQNRLNIGLVLEALAVQMNGEISLDSERVMKAFEAYETKMDSLDEEKMLTALPTDPFWAEWNRIGEELLKDLIEIK